ncbi:MAG: superoxide dismutase [Olpidium bornovanus]|uniref:Superoxide dismutase n=1 Tax=Olpidium bornovanus TaxID=278681 RepID=A0A8H8DMG8_9FUNG|nr:MAG: superoxide dismutase [Olpidium bornovanus]
MLAIATGFVVLAFAALAKTTGGPTPFEAAASGGVPSAQGAGAGAICVLQPTARSSVSGVAEWIPTAGGLVFRVRATGAKPNGAFGIHVHEFGDISNKTGGAAGEHFNPTGEPHSCPDPQSIAITGGIHGGDLGNVESDRDGVIDVAKSLFQLHSIQSVEKQDVGFIIGRSLILHSKQDDCRSQPSGNSGERVAQCVIGYRNPRTKSREADVPQCHFR